MGVGGGEFGTYLRNYVDTILDGLKKTVIKSITQL